MVILSRLTKSTEHPSRDTKEPMSPRLSESFLVAFAGVAIQGLASRVLTSKRKRFPHTETQNSPPSIVDTPSLQTHRRPPPQTGPSPRSRLEGLRDSQTGRCYQPYFPALEGGKGLQQKREPKQFLELFRSVLA